ncbi:MAG TPA: prolyl oligopeptidase family serine peptidase [Gemmatimonadaceae bacterium]|nr:prolyl oligopeptidase family serine peptidase [Gemmatimonadaceae bacterium]
MRAIAISAIALGMLAAPVGAQQPAPSQKPDDVRQPAPVARATAFDFSIENIMRGPEIYGRPPERVNWTPDSRWIYFYWNPPGTDWREDVEPYRVRAQAGAKPEKVDPAVMDSVGPLLQEGSESRDHRLRAVSYRGDVYLVDTRSSTARRLTHTRAVESEPRISPDGRTIYFVRDDNAFSLDPSSGALAQLTDIRQGPKPKTDEEKRKDESAQRRALEEDQRKLFEVIRDQYRADSIDKAREARRDSLFPTPLYLGKDEKVQSVDVSPDGSALILTTRIPAEKAQETAVPHWVTKSGYVEDRDAREKVGDAQDGGRVAYVNLPSGDAHWLQVIPGDTVNSPAMVQVLGWNDAGREALVFAVPSNYKARYLQTVSGDSGRVKMVDVLRDSAWVGGPCFGCGGWYDQGRRFWFVSEADGWAHIYTMSADGSDRKQLTSGKWEVDEARVSSDGRWFYFQSSEVSPFERHFYRMSVNGGKRERITTVKGGHDVTVSPDGKLLADVYSSSNRPPDIFLMPFTAGAKMSQLTTSATKEWLSFRWIDPEIVMIPASDGVQVPARIYRPSDMNAKPNGSAVIFVHGAGYLHNVVNYWSDYPREYMFNQYLASKGYVVIDADYRGSAGYGRDWRVAIYRHMGGRDLQDEVDASRYLQKEFDIPPERIGIYGGSYGGFMTLMALFTEPKHFGAGAALRSVTDWAHYNHWYTSRILNLPQDDSVAYRRSSPIYFAEGLEDPLLMAHGMVDNNVEFQDIVRLTQRLIELGKTNWTLAPYPVESHAFVRPSSWADEYRRIFDLFERELGAQRENAAAGADGVR